MLKDGFTEFKNREDSKLGFSEDLAVLAKPLKIGSHTAHNRIVYQPMEGCDGTSDGAPDDLTIRRYRRLAAGGMGILWFEATACMETGRANPRQLWITENNLDAFKRIVSEIKEICMKENGFSPVVIMQNTHSGRYSKPYGKPLPVIARNNTIFEKDSPIDPDRIVSDEELDKVSEALVENARLAELAGFDGVDVKCCHGYLQNEMFSCYNRPGRYGGSLENRSRLLRETVSGINAIKSRDFIVTTRFNIYDGFPYPEGFGVSKDGGLEPDYDEPGRVIAWLYELGVRLINITMGNPYVNPHVNRPYKNSAFEPPMSGVARLIEGCIEVSKEFKDIATVCSGFSYPEEYGANIAAYYVGRDDFAFAGFGRQIFAYPDLARDIIGGDGLSRNKCCITCGKCTEIMRAGGTPGCVVRDAGVYFPIYKKYVKNTL
ncbi:MAG: flavin oxidoreductase/NADH oxidase [Clostridiales bacterium]|jgi:2,4-dienoyl-CoA reductase-like NADH-dependent reductase (Old Yellow Enzyme family)|nr:flavin oxidoreductase/NADH oxidase [Clostridiales bacterium]